VIAVLPGVYTENISLRPFVRLFAVDPTTTSDSSVITTSTADPLLTVIRGVNTASPTVTAYKLTSFVGLESEIAGLTIATPLGDPALGVIDPASTAISTFDSSIIIDKDYIADAGNGIWVTTSGANAPTPQVNDNVIVGNYIGMVVLDDGTTSGAVSPIPIINN